MPKKIKTSASANAHYENEEHRVYAFHNIMFNFILYINAKTADDAMENLINVVWLIEIIGK